MILSAVSLTFVFLFWGISSVGLERLLDRQEVTGSNPVYPTFALRSFMRSRAFLLYKVLESACGPLIREGLRRASPLLQYPRILNNFTIFHPHFHFSATCLTGKRSLPGRRSDSNPVYPTLIIRQLHIM